MSDGGSNRVNRGGSWNNNARNCRSANRNDNSPGNRNNNLGFRLASSRHCAARRVHGCAAGTCPDQRPVPVPEAKPKPSDKYEKPRPRPVGGRKHAARTPRPGTY